MGDGGGLRRGERIPEETDLREVVAAPPSPNSPPRYLERFSPTRATSLVLLPKCLAIIHDQFFFFINFIDEIQLSPLPIITKVSID